MPTFDCGSSGLTGTVGCTILDATGAEHVARTTAGITEPIAGSGIYRIAEHDATATLTYVWDVGVGTIGASETLYAGRGDRAANADAVWDEALADHAIVGSTGAKLAAAAAAGDPWEAELPGDYEEGTAGALLPDLSGALAALGAGSVTVSSPVSPSGSITIYQGDDYDAARGRGISFSVKDSTHALGLDDPAAVLSLKSVEETWIATSVTSTSAGYTVVFEPTKAQTAALTIPTQSYELEATLADGDVVTLATGTLYSVKDIPLA